MGRIKERTHSRTVWDSVQSGVLLCWVDYPTGLVSVLTNEFENLSTTTDLMPLTSST
ncbi:hypothetical protein SBF1_1510002 [Candidatus Desulfosporosinus infrequens]|uniref:Uncharacterized protein n=1 Tax=Candidatus Desulfosporosinus infrequens TaxID=2043169 RepID=A0A2U3K7I2_9FIRM|nr:hypothetical protein SBF1_1510002 [Candidatus Desulfosporosinus infrequens]